MKDDEIVPWNSWDHANEWKDVLNESLGPELSVDALGIVRAKVWNDPCTEFHNKMTSGTTLRTLASAPAHLAAWETPLYVGAIKRSLKHGSNTGLACDVGCGDGRFTELLFELGYARVVALDSNLHSLRALAHYAAGQSWRDRLLIVHSSAEKTPLRSGCADAVLAIGVLYYLDSQFESGIAEMSRLLSGQGILVESEPDYSGALLKSLLYGSLDDFLETAKTRRFHEVHEGEKFYFPSFDRSEVVHILGKHKLEVELEHPLSIFPSILRIELTKGRIPSEEVVSREAEIQKVFSDLDGSDAPAKHVIRSSRRVE